MELQKGAGNDDADQRTSKPDHRVYTRWVGIWQSAVVIHNVTPSTRRGMMRLKYDGDSTSPRWR